MAALEPVLVVSDLNPDGTAPGSSSTVPGVISAAITWALNVPESISYQATGPETSALTPGQAPSGTRVIGISLGNGDKMDTRMLSGGAEVVYDEPAHVDETGEGLARVLGTSRIGRLSVQQVTFSDVITAAQGKIQFQTGGTLRPSTLLPDVAGIGATPLNPSGKASALDFTFLVDPALANDPLDLDLNRDTRLRSLETVVERIGTISDPLRAQFVCDSGDFGVDGGTSQSVTIGHKGSGAYLHFDGTSAGNVPYMVQRQTHAQAQTKDMEAKFDRVASPAAPATTGCRTAAASPVSRPLTVCTPTPPAITASGCRSSASTWTRTTAASTAGPGMVPSMR